MFLMLKNTAYAYTHMRNVGTARQYAQVRSGCVWHISNITKTRQGGNNINIKHKIVERFKQLCAERNITYMKLAQLSNVAPSTVYSMLQPNREDISIITVNKLCNGLDISLSEFFSDGSFKL